MNDDLRNEIFELKKRLKKTVRKKKRLQKTDILKEMEHSSVTDHKSIGNYLGNFSKKESTPHNITQEFIKLETNPKCSPRLYEKWQARLAHYQSRTGRDKTYP